MRNLLLVLAELLISYISLVIMAKKYKTDGIYVYTIIATIASCVMNLKEIELMNINIPLGLCVTSSIIVAGNLLTQLNGKDELKHYIITILMTGIITYLVIYLSKIIIISDYNYYANNSYDNIFDINIKSSLALIISILFGVWINSNLYYTIKRLKNVILYSNTLSVIITELFENIIFVILTYIFDYQPIDIFLCIIIRYIIKTTIAILGTLPLYIVNKDNY